MNINLTLEQAPNEIAKLAEVAEESRFLWKEADIRLKQTEAQMHLMLKAEKPSLTVADLRAEVESTDEIYKQRLSVITHESEYKKECIKLERWVNAFNSARKLANVTIEEMRSLHNTVGEHKKNYSND